MVRPAVIVQVKKQITDKWDYFDVLKNTSETAEETAKAFGSKEEIGCNMRRSDEAGKAAPDASGRSDGMETCLISSSLRWPTVSYWDSSTS